MGDSNSLRLVAFRLGSLVCGTAATVVREVIGFERATRIPGAADSVSGLVNFRGRLLTVVDGRVALGLAGGGPLKRPEAVLVLEVAGRTQGLAVDEVLDLMDVTPEAGEAAAAGVDPGLIQGVARVGDDRILILNPEMLFAPILS